MITNNDIKSARCFKILFLKKFKLKDLGQVGRSLQGISLCQRKYALEILQDVGFLGANAVLFPLEQNLRLTRDDRELLTNLIVFQRLIGRLIYVTITRFDLSCWFIVSFSLWTSLNSLIWQPLIMFYSVLKIL